MSELKKTSEWKAVKDIFRLDVWSVNGRALIATIPNVASSSHDEQIANANLIASSPELLKALEALRDELYLHAEGNYFLPMLRNADRAIAKAKGELDV